MEYQAVAESYLEREYPHPNVFRGVFPSWDNTPRTGNRAVIVLGATPDNYQYWLAECIRKTAEDFPNQDRLVFINAWNEWAEGCHLEPDRQFKHGFLEATLLAKNDEPSLQRFVKETAVSGGNIPRRTLLGDVRSVATYHGMRFLGQVVSWLKKWPRLRSLIRWLVHGQG